ncbi:carbon starvation CstA family protein [Sphingomonas quercus]|uniref:carbon starvation CstA family protein n=1 Tax=Sphingomonas quercus TaxID=2842451 RepID=UPI00209B9698|nr:carbon starvation CstA family protein [Sphingomonas quercus]
MLRKHGIWILVAALGAVALGVVALSRGEQINALWMLTAAVCTYLVAYRYYSRFVAEDVALLSGNRVTPAVAQNDGLDYVPTNKYVLFGHHFAAIAGAGPLVGPVLAAQLGYLPSILWIIIGAVVGGCVQDFIILVMSTRRGGRSLGEMIREEFGQVAGVTAQIGTFAIMIIILAVLALIVVKALAHSPWGTFTVAATVPIAILMGLYTRFIQPARIAEVSIGGFVLMMLATVGGQYVAASPTLAPWFTLTEVQVCWVLIIYGIVASTLPVWLLLAPRGYLSTFMKIGVIVLLAIGLVLARPMLEMPATTKFIDGTGPVWTGPVFPFLFITIACGAVSGFHALISSGTTPKQIADERDARLIGYGAMLMESFVAVMALISACVLNPSIYFTMNSPGAVVGTTAESAATAVTKMGFPADAQEIKHTADQIGEASIISRAGGAPTLAVGMAHIFSRVIGEHLMAFWYHFAILFEALFILTAVDSGTRSGRFMLQDLIGGAIPAFRRTSALIPNLVATTLCVAAWGFFLYQGATDPLGGVNTLWPLFALSNQMLAGIALTFATVALIKTRRARFAWVTGLPAVWLLICTMTAGLMKIFSPDPALGFVAQARAYSAAIAEGRFMGPAKTVDQMRQIVQNGWVDAALCAFFVVMTLVVVLIGVKTALAALKDADATARLDPSYVPSI